MSTVLEQPKTIRYGIDALYLAGPVRPRDLRDHLPDLIVIHRNTIPELVRSQGSDERSSWHGPGVDLELTANWYADPTNRWRSRIFPYHFFIHRSGQVFQIHDPLVVSPHARGKNKKSIGVALGIDGRREKPTPEMIQAVHDLVSMYRRYQPNAVLIKHSERKQCPGRLVDISTLDPARQE